MQSAFGALTQTVYPGYPTLSSRVVLPETFGVAGALRAGHEGVTPRDTDSSAPQAPLPP